MRYFKAFALLACFLACLINLEGCGAPSGPDGDDYPFPSALMVQFTGQRSPMEGVFYAEEDALHSSHGLRAGVRSGRGECIITADWTQCPDEDFHQYELYRSKTPIIESDPSEATLLGVFFSPSELTYIDEDVIWEDTYYYAIRTTNVAGFSSWSNQAEITTPAEGAPTPSILSGQVDASNVYLSWTHCPDDDFHSYMLYRSYEPGIAEDPESAENLETFYSSTDTAFVDNTLTELTAYYALRTNNDSGLQSWSNELQATLCNGSIIAWGNNDWGQLNVPDPNQDFIAIGAGETHSIGLQADGSVQCWGMNNDGQCDVPSPNNGFVAVAGGNIYSLGLKSDGSVVGWGYDYWGQCDFYYDTAPYTYISAGAGYDYTTAGVREDGMAFIYGELAYYLASAPHYLPAPHNYVSVAVGEMYCIGLRSDGSISIVADGWSPRLPDPNSGFVAIASGESHCLGLKSDGSIVCWGDNTDGQCDVPWPNQDFVAVAAGWNHSIGLKSDGSVVCWGNNQHGQCQEPSPNVGFVAIDGGGFHSLGLRTSSR